MTDACALLLQVSTTVYNINQPHQEVVIGGGDATSVSERVMVGQGSVRVTIKVDGLNNDASTARVSHNSFMGDFFIFGTSTDVCFCPPFCSTPWWPYMLA